MHRPRSRSNPGALQAIADKPDHEPTSQLHLDFPSSGSILAPSWSHAEADAILETCKWIYHLAHGTTRRHLHLQGPGLITLAMTTGTASWGATTKTTAKTMPTTMTTAWGTPTYPGDGACSGKSRRRQRTILIHCPDGYTESTMLGIAYYSYSTGRPVPTRGSTRTRPCGATSSPTHPTSPSSSSIAPRLLRESPVCAGKTLAEITALLRDEPAWFAGLDGSFPSRITDYMYLGNLTHANNPSLLKALGITQILSVGETAMWRDGELEDWGLDNVCLGAGSAGQRY